MPIVALQIRIHPRTPETVFIRLSNDSISKSKQGSSLYYFTVRFEGMRESVSQWLAKCAQPVPIVKPYPGWRLGAGEKRSGRLSTELRRQIWHAIKVPVVTPWLDGLSIYAYPGNETSRAIFVTGNYEPNEFFFLSQVIRPGMTFIDAGANMGLYSLFAAQKVAEHGTVLAIEPSTREGSRLSKNVKINSLSNVRLIRNAVSDSCSDVELLIADDEWSGHNTLGAFAYDTPLARKEMVQTVSLDDIAVREGLSRVDIIKMDIEGAELHALKGAAGILERFQPLLLLELADRALCHQGSSSSEVWDFFYQRRYRIFAFDPTTGLLVPARQQPYYDSENVVAVPESSAAAVAWRSGE